MRKKPLEETIVSPVFLPYYSSLSVRTQKRQKKELASLNAFLGAQGVAMGDLLAEGADWVKLTAELIRAYLEQLKEQGQKDSSLALQCHTFKHYAYLAMLAGVMETSQYTSIDPIRVPWPKQSEVVYHSLTHEQVQPLLQPQPGHRGSRDALCMALLLLGGLWPRSIVALNRSSFDLEAHTITFYDYHAGQWQMWHLVPQVLTLATQYLASPSPYKELLFPGNHRQDSPSLRWSDRALNVRVRDLGERIGIPVLLPRDCHLYWKTTFADITEQSLIASWSGDPPAEDESASTPIEMPRSGALQERAAAIAAHFRHWARELQEVHQEVDSLVDHYPRFRSEPGYGLLLMHLLDAVEEAKGLEDYVRHATDEDWSKERGESL